MRTATIQGVFADRFQITGLTLGDAQDLVLDVAGQVGQVAAALGQQFMPWQQHVADVALEVELARKDRHGL